MNGEDRPKTLWKILKKRLGFTGLACCGPSWNMRVSDVEEEEDEEAQIYGDEEAQFYGEEEPMIEGRLNLAMVLAAERIGSVTPTTQFKTLMRLFEEIDDKDEMNNNTRHSKEGAGIDAVCCVCMERNKGAAFIPCGHTYCRICSRKLWLNRGLCPLCNNTIDDILDIF
ncbi:hypothetical protein A4A49_38701 [Nicotiana attenuata]|uniref:RING-type domain-containing protein n=1 Tax=Nicotiana attenuata TaxID=49451 RepID=A0A1J6KQE1_NICAT|nr:hypothetical protein A4A49_38701 [Nicotiana attenuata]